MKNIYFYSKFLNYTFWNRITQSTKITESSLGIFRWLVGIFILLFATSDFLWISQVPDAFFNPPYLSLANLFNQFPGYLFFYLIDILTIISIFFLLLV